jgi:hypothetical protein
VTEQTLLFHLQREETCPVPTPAAPFARGSKTSESAARSIGGRSRGDREKIREFLRLRKEYGATDEEIGRFLGMAGDTVRPRRGELVDCGLVVNSGRTRLTSRGRRLATVWILTEFAAAAAVDPSPAGPPPF